MKRCENNTPSHNNSKKNPRLPTCPSSQINLSSADNSFLFYSWFPCGKSSFVAIILPAWLEGCISFYYDLMFAKLNVCGDKFFTVFAYKYYYLIIRMCREGPKMYEHAQLPAGCGVCHTLSSDSWRPFDEGCAHCPVLRALLTPADSHPWLLVWSQPSHSWPFSLPAAFCFPSNAVFSKEPCFLMICLKGKSFSFVIFASGDVLGYIFSRTRMFIIPVVRDQLDRYNKLTFLWITVSLSNGWGWMHNTLTHYSNKYLGNLSGYVWTARKQWPWPRTGVLYLTSLTLVLPPCWHVTTELHDHKMTMICISWLAVIGKNKSDVCVKP